MSADRGARARAQRARFSDQGEERDFKKTQCSRIESLQWLVRTEAFDKVDSTRRCFRMAGLSRLEMMLCVVCQAIRAHQVGGVLVERTVAEVAGRSRTVALLVLGFRAASRSDQPSSPTWRRYSRHCSIPSRRCSSSRLETSRFTGREPAPGTAEEEN